MSAVVEKQWALTVGEKAQNEWEPQLREIVSTVNTNFEANMAEMGCAGCVELDAPSDDFANWALLLKVKYRDSEELQQLTSSRQSGGERSVATILYLIALQVFPPSSEN